MTKNRAAAEVRHEIMRAMRRLEKKYKNYEQRWDHLDIFIRGMAQRASARKGGLGRK